MSWESSMRRRSASLAAAILASAISLAAPVSGQSGHEVQTGFLDRSITIAGHTYPYQVYVPRAYALDTEQRFPVILFLHGAGERGDDGLAQTEVGLGPALRRYPSRYPAIVVFPQAPRDSAWTGRVAEAAMAALEQTEREFRTDPERVYLTGISMGGHGTWYLAYRHPDRFAAIAPVCGFIDWRFGGRDVTVVPPADGDPFEALARRLASVPTWIFHGEADPAVPVEQSRRAAKAFEAAGAADVRYSELPGIGHNAWDPAYASPGFAEWLFAQRRGAKSR
jgi:predicted peptidase